jgi:NAD(P)-dependent dehydrogenase (short-subunit alcohol dehydrogenase family)
MNARCAVVTGAASGIGRAIALRLASDGNEVIATDIDRDGLEQTLAVIESRSGTGRTVALDVADPGAIQSFVSAQGPFDVLVNNAAIGDSTPTRELSMDRIRRILDVNLYGAIELSLAALPALSASENPRILNIASIQGFVGTRNALAYATAKAGLLGFTRALAADAAIDGILVNALAPGFVDTPMAIVDGRSEYDSALFRQVYVEHGGIPLRRPSTPTEQAEIAAFLCSPANTYITGQTIIADGGMTSTFA